MSRFFAAFILVLVACFIINSGLTFAYVTDGAIYLPPDYTTFTPPLPGGSYTDPIFGTAIKRITDSMHTADAARGGMVTTIGNEYSTMSAFNKDNTRLLLGHFSYFALYDGAGNFIRDLLEYRITSSSEPRWSRTDPNVFYYVSGNQLKRFNVGTYTSSVVHTFSEYTAFSGKGESDISFDGNYFVLAGDSRYIFVYDISTDTKGPILDAGANVFDNLYITPDNHVIVGWIVNGSGRFNGMELFDKDMNFLRQVAHALGHMDVTRDTNGEEVLLWVNGADAQLQVPCEAGVTKIRLSDSKQTCVWKGNWNWHVAYHISAPDNSGWFFMESYAPSDPIPPTGWNPYTNEILQVKLDGSEIRRVAHHHSRPFNSYMYQPKVSTNREGTKLVYASNFGLQSILGYPSLYSDAYMIDVLKAGQTIAFGALGNKTYGDAAFTVSATASSNLAVTFSASGSCTVSGNTVTLTGIGSCTITAQQAGNSNYLAAADVTQSFTIGQPTGTLYRIEQNNSSVLFSGNWASNNMTVHSGGSAKLAMDLVSKVSFTFTGNKVTWIAYRDRWSGIARVYIDGTLKATVDTYSSIDTAKTPTYTASGLTWGTHTITIEVANQKNASSGGKWVWIDAFDYVGTR